MGLSTVSQNLNAIWQDYLKHLAFAMRNLNMIIDSPIIISGYLAPYLVPEDLNMLLHLINENNPFTLTADQLAGRHTWTIYSGYWRGTALYQPIRT